MPNSIDATGLHFATRAELIAAETAAMQLIYGPDINLDSDSPDGQAMGIRVQAVLDLQDLLAQIYSSFDPDLAVGVTLDERAAINGVQRQAGTFTLTNITLVVDRALNLAGLDGAINDPNGTGYTVSDNSGNQWVLATSQVIGAAGTYVFQFRAKNAGAVLTTPNTITLPVTVVLGVVTINNPTVFTTLGLNEETDAQVRIRRSKSVSLSSQGYLAGLLASLLNINGLTSAFIYENVTGTTDADAIPGHSIWVIVNGGDNASIAKAIYSKRNAGCGMKGSVSFIVTQADGTPFLVKWDVVTPQPLYIKFTATSINGVDTIDTANIKAKLVTLLTPGVFERVNINELSTLVQEIDPNCLVVPTVGDGFSTAALGPFTTTLRPTGKDNQFAVSSANITITVV